MTGLFVKTIIAAPSIWVCGRCGSTIKEIPLLLKNSRARSGPLLDQLRRATSRMNPIVTVLGSYVIGGGSLRAKAMTLAVQATSAYLSIERAERTLMVLLYIAAISAGEPALAKN